MYFILLSSASWGVLSLVRRSQRLKKIGTYLIRAFILRLYLGPLVKGRRKVAVGSYFNGVVGYSVLLRLFFPPPPPPSQLLVL
jgi:hypothetical protein